MQMKIATTPKGLTPRFCRFLPLEEGKDLLTMGKKQNERCNNSAVHGWVEGSRSLLQISKKYNQTLPQP